MVTEEARIAPTAEGASTRTQGPQVLGGGGIEEARIGPTAEGASTPLRIGPTAEGASTTTQGPQVLGGGGIEEARIGPTAEGASTIKDKEAKTKTKKKRSDHKSIVVPPKWFGRRWVLPSGLLHENHNAITEKAMEPWFAYYYRLIATDENHRNAFDKDGVDSLDPNADNLKKFVEDLQKIHNAVIQLGKKCLEDILLEKVAAEGFLDTGGQHPRNKQRCLDRLVCLATSQDDSEMRDPLVAHKLVHAAVHMKDSVWHAKIGDKLEEFAKNRAHPFTFEDSYNQQGGRKHFKHALLRIAAEGRSRETKNIKETLKRATHLSLNTKEVTLPQNDRSAQFLIDLSTNTLKNPKAKGRTNNTYLLVGGDFMAEHGLYSVEDVIVWLQGKPEEVAAIKMARVSLQQNVDVTGACQLLTKAMKSLSDGEENPFFGAGHSKHKRGELGDGHSNEAEHKSGELGVGGDSSTPPRTSGTLDDPQLLSPMEFDMDFSQTQPFGTSGMDQVGTGQQGYPAAGMVNQNNFVPVPNQPVGGNHPHQGHAAMSSYGNNDGSHNQAGLPQTHHQLSLHPQQGPAPPATTTNLWNDQQVHPQQQMFVHDQQMGGTSSQMHPQQQQQRQRQWQQQQMFAPGRPQMGALATMHWQQRQPQVDPTTRSRPTSQKEARTILGINGAAAGESGGEAVSNADNVGEVRTVLCGVVVRHACSLSRDPSHPPKRTEGWQGRGE